MRPADPWGSSGIRQESVLLLDVSHASEFEKLLIQLPTDIRAMVEPRIREVTEIRLPLGQNLEVVYQGKLRVTYPRKILVSDILMLDGGGAFRKDGRRGVDGALHRIARFTDVSGDVASSQGGKSNLFILRLGRVLLGIAEPLRDALMSALHGILLIGPPAVGKTTLLRDIIRILQERFGGSLLVIDTSLELCGEGDTPHPFLNMATRLMVGHPTRQKAVIDAAIMNGGAECLLFDEIGYRDDVDLVAFAANRGLMAVGSVHSHTLQGVMTTKALRPLLGLQADGTVDPNSQPVFNMAIEVRGQGQLRIYHHVDQSIQDILEGRRPQFEDVMYVPGK